MDDVSSIAAAESLQSSVPPSTSAGVTAASSDTDDDATTINREQVLPAKVLVGVLKLSLTENGPGPMMKDRELSSRLVQHGFTGLRKVVADGNCWARSVLWALLEGLHDQCSSATAKAFEQYGPLSLCPIP